MGYTKDLLLIQLAHAKQAVERAKNNRYSDFNKQKYQETLLKLFEKVEQSVGLNLNNFVDDSEIYDGPKKHIDFIFKSLEFLDNSTLNQIPYEIVECLNFAMQDWLVPEDKNKFIIVTSLINNIIGFSYERKLAVDETLYDDIATKYSDIIFDHRLVQINLPRSYSRDYLGTVVLYHELGHFIDARYRIVKRAYYFLLQGISTDSYSADEIISIKKYLPELKAFIENDKNLDHNSASVKYRSSYYHLTEYFCDLFATQYIGKASNLYVTYLTEDSPVISITHPLSSNRAVVINDCQNGVPNFIVSLINFTLGSLGMPTLSKRYTDLLSDDFFQLVPSIINNALELHGVLNTAWRIWLDERTEMLSKLNTDNNLKCYNAINNLVEKSIGNFIAFNEWKKARGNAQLSDSSNSNNLNIVNDIDIIQPGHLCKVDIYKLQTLKSLIIRPLFTYEQIGEVGIDFRLGYDFLVSIQGRDAFINASKNDWQKFGTQRDTRYFFQSTRRQLGETFILHPHQTVLAVTLEYVKLPDDCMLELVMRSSYARLGITINTIAQPGYAGCLNLELTNNNNNPINLAVGARIVQGILHKLSASSAYFSSPRKYVCQVRPEPSAVINDQDLEILTKLWEQNNHINS